MGSPAATAGSMVVRDAAPSAVTRSQAAVVASAGRARITTIWMMPPSTRPANDPEQGADHAQASRMIEGRVATLAPEPERLEVS